VRVLFTSVPQAGHLYPLLPLARAFAELGDEVLVASAAQAASAAERAGLPVAPVGTELGVWWQQLAERVRGTPGAGLPPERIGRYFVPRLFAEIGAAASIDDLLGLCREWRPDLLVFDPFAFAGPLAAALLELPGVQHGLGPAPEPLTLELAADALSPLWRSFGRDVPDFAGLFDELTLNICPAALESTPAPPGAPVHDLRPADVDPAGADRPPSCLLGLPERPTVYATLGTFSNGDFAVFRSILDGLAAEPVNLVVTVGTENDPADLGPVPANARIERYVPQASLLPYCSAVIHHAGSGTMLGALAHGLPALVIPQGADNFVNADRVVTSGAARRLLPDQVDAGAVRANLAELLVDSRYRDRAGKVAAQIAGMPAPVEVAATLQDRYR
jgi:UDP:flavonoid glycosyltransferase YjiC (YdhE family)